MNRNAIPALILTLLLSACARQSPAIDAPPQAAVTAEPTADSALGGLGGLSPAAGATSQPTAAPTVDPAKVFAVQRSTIDNTLTLGAQVAPRQYTMSFAQDGIIKEIYVKPGQTIAEGDLVAQLDLGELGGQLSEAQLGAAQAQRAIGQAAQASELEVQQAQLLVDAAQLDLAKAKAPPTPLAIAQAQSAQRGAQANLDTVRNNASQAKNQAKQAMEKAIIDLQALQDQHAKALAQLQRAKDSEAKDLQAKIEELEAAIREAEAAVSLAVINFDTARNNEVAAVNDAQAKLDLAKAELDAQLSGPDQFVVAEKERAVRAAQLGVAQARQRSAPDPALTAAVESGRLRIQQIQDQIAERQLYAPFGGEVASININPGEPAPIGTPVITLIDRSQLELVAQAADLQVDGRPAPQVSAGQPVSIAFARYPGQVFSGTLSLAPLATPAGADAGDTAYHFTFDPQERSFDPGDLAELQLSLGRRYNALWLPPAALRITRDRTTATLRVGSETKRVDLLTGIITADKVEILSGLKEGDEVLGE